MFITVFSIMNDIVYIKTFLKSFAHSEVIEVFKWYMMTPIEFTNRAKHMTLWPI